MRPAPKRGQKIPRISPRLIEKLAGAVSPGQQRFITRSAGRIGLNGARRRVVKNILNRTADHTRNEVIGRDILQRGKRVDVAAIAHNTIVAASQSFVDFIHAMGDIKNGAALITQTPDGGKQFFDLARFERLLVGSSNAMTRAPARQRAGDFRHLPLYARWQCQCALLARGSIFSPRLSRRFFADSRNGFQRTHPPVAGRCPR